MSQSTVASNGAPGFAKQMLRLVLSLLGLALDEADALYKRAVWIFIGLIAMIPIELALNFFGYPKVNNVIGLCLAAVTMVAFGKPKNVMAAGAASILIAKPIFGLYWDTLKWMLLGETVISFYLGHVSFAENPMVIFTIIAGCIPIVIMGKIWEKELGGTIGVEILYSGLIAMVVMDFMSLFPKEFWTSGSTTLAHIEHYSHRPGMAIAVLTMAALYIFVTMRSVRSDEKLKWVLAFGALGFISWLIFSPPPVVDVPLGEAEAAKSTVVATSAYKPVPLTIPTGKSIPADRPAGYYLAAVDCPASIVYDVVDSSTGNVVEQQDCASRRDPNRHIPLNTNLVIYQKADSGDPVDVIVYWKKL